MGRPPKTIAEKILAEAFTLIAGRSIGLAG